VLSLIFVIDVITEVQGVVA